MGPAARWLRAALGAAVSVGFATAAHTAAGHHPPLWLVLATVIGCVPLCALLAGRWLSRWRLGLGVLLSQGLFHTLFSVLPQPPGPAMAPPEGGGAAHHGSHAPDPATPLTPLDSAVAVDPEPALLTVLFPALANLTPAMAVGHLVAGVLSYLFLRRGELIVEAISARFGLRPAILLLFGDNCPRHRRPTRPALGATPHRGSPASAWIGRGPRTLRGPPALDVVSA